LFLIHSSLMIIDIKIIKRNDNINVYNVLLKYNG
jgi:hypothetical protein